MKNERTPDSHQEHFEERHYVADFQDTWLCVQEGVFHLGRNADRDPLLTMPVEQVPDLIESIRFLLEDEPND